MPTSSSPASVHPHACGAYCILNFEVVAVNGSSPRLWGIPRKRIHFLRCCWFIPTPVGHTLDVLYLSLAFVGSSPRLWGIREKGGRTGRLVRFIPTPVGHTDMQMRRRAVYAVHPHACGAYALPFLGMSSALGSSPRLWGILIHTDSPFDLTRFIPTPVGHTLEKCTHFVTFMSCIPSKSTTVLSG